MSEVKGDSAAAPSRLDVMNFLNEMAEHFPEAVSFASGRPAGQFFELQRWIDQLPRFAGYFAGTRQAELPSVLSLLAQYGSTNGIINDLVARQVNTDDGMHCSGKQILVTAGCQEAMELCVKLLCQDKKNAILVRSPTYIGITGVAALNGVSIVPFNCNEATPFLTALRIGVAEAEQRGLRPRVLYLVPDFDNPTGDVLSREIRQQTLAFCASKHILILEDNPYGMFRYDGERISSMFSLDSYGCVIYLGTYSKTLCPALRVGFAIVPEHLFGSAAGAARLLAELSQAKSFMTVNTSQIAQAIVGAILLSEECSLQRLVRAPTAHYRENRNTMLAALKGQFGEPGDSMSWNTPAGGFFLTISLPFDFKHREAEICARDYGVLTMPLAFFSFDTLQDRKVRLAFSNVSRTSIATGIERFGAYVKDRIAHGHAA